MFHPNFECSEIVDSGVAEDSDMNSNFSRGKICHQLRLRLRMPECTLCAFQHVVFKSGHSAQDPIVFTGKTKGMLLSQMSCLVMMMLYDKVHKVMFFSYNPLMHVV